MQNKQFFTKIEEKRIASFYSLIVLGAVYYSCNKQEAVFVSRKQEQADYEKLFKSMKVCHLRPRVVRYADYIGYATIIPQCTWDYPLMVEAFRRYIRHDRG